MATSKIKITKAAIKMPTTIGDQLIRVQDIDKKLTGNTYIADGWSAGTLTQAIFKLNVTAFIDAEVDVKFHLPGAVALRESAFVTVKKDLDLIKAMVQGVANTMPTLAATIIESAGFFVAAQRGGQKRQNAAFNTEIPGTVLLTADGEGHREWEMSKDMINIIQLPATSTSKTTVPNLTLGDSWYFRSKKVDTKKNTYNWCGWILLKIGAGGRNVGGGGTQNNAGSLPTQ
jgi:hypothetical protein